MAFQVLKNVLIAVSLGCWAECPAGRGYPVDGFTAIESINDIITARERELILQAKGVAEGILLTVYEEFWRFHSRIPSFGLELGNKIGGTFGKEVTQETFPFGLVLIIRGVEFTFGGIGMHIAPIIAPTGGFVIDGSRDGLVEAVPQLYGTGFGKHASV